MQMGGGGRWEVEGVDRFTPTLMRISGSSPMFYFMAEASPNFSAKISAIFIETRWTTLQMEQ